jgi:hypothetical protein
VFGFGFGFRLVSVSLDRVKKKAGRFSPPGPDRHCCLRQVWRRVPDSSARDVHRGAVAFASVIQRFSHESEFISSSLLPSALSGWLYLRHVLVDADRSQESALIPDFFRVGVGD